MKQNNQNYQEIFQKQSKLLFERAEKLTLLFDDIFIKQKKKLMLEASWMQNQINNNGSGEENNGIHIQEMENIKQIISFNNDKIECYSQIKENFDQIIFQTKQIAQAIVFEQQGLKNIQISLYNQLFFFQNFDEFPLGYENIKTNQQTIKNLENKLLYQNKQIQSFKQALTQAEKQIQDLNKQNNQQIQQQQHKLQIQEQNENDLKNMQKNQDGPISSKTQDIDKQQIQNQNAISKKEDKNVMQNLEDQNIDVLTGKQRVTVKLENSLNQILQLGEIQNSGSQEILTQLFEKSKEKIYNLILLNDQLEKKQEEYLLQVEKMKTILEKEQDEKKQLEIDIKVLQHKYKMPLN
ncbi:hypothetical protein PPERSA_10453 [Pseudocohnilembus persalinus]|uniref:Uncharacterized protein n=1 Tax=Pseudocohnilembus persalinus TaxID=266149 RepID=A0A0V0R0V5_PSEPJ|nr:hypothetical protein PPERSA_10453 [Pseudocohnilembus persalinus]|eukprot:KRX08091.1 hypothetical protein PPERSA_10453 [Pseudocohnilembus persalinus]